MKELTLSDFLRARRASVMRSGESSSRSLRRAPGLRREEVARGAGVSVDYYVKIEQGSRKVTPSDSVLRALADVLQLDEPSREHMYDLARRDARGRMRPSATAQAVQVGMLRLMESLGGLPALILGRRTDILAATPAIRLLLAEFNAMPPGDRNGARWALLDERARRVFPDWEPVAAGLAGMLRMYCGRYPSDPLAAELVDELSAKSEIFNDLWAESRASRTPVREFKIVDNEIVGRIRLDVETVQSATDPDQALVVMMPASDSASQSAVRELQRLAGAPTR